MQFWKTRMILVMVSTNLFRVYLYLYGITHDDRWFNKLGEKVSHSLFLFVRKTYLEKVKSDTSGYTQNIFRIWHFAIASKLCCLEQFGSKKVPFILQRALVNLEQLERGIAWGTL